MNTKIWFLTIGLILFGVCHSDAQTVKNVGAGNGTAIEVIDFHNTHRCKTCLAIENSAKEVLYQEFSEAVQAGKIIFKTVNVDEDANLALAEKFEASGSALFIYNPRTGQATDLTDFAFTYAMSDATKLKQGIKQAIQNALKP